jgi:hypothetical protein
MEKEKNAEQQFEFVGSRNVKVGRYFNNCLVYHHDSRMITRRVTTQAEARDMTEIKYLSYVRRFTTMNLTDIYKMLYESNDLRR